MIFHEDVDFNRLIGYSTILYDETSSKKTYYTAKFLQFLIKSKSIDPKHITILDFAPEVSIIKDIKIGGKIEDFYNESIECNNISFEGEIIPPRLTSNNRKELYEYAFKNYNKTHETLRNFNENPTSILIINDISIYLHKGNKKYLLETIKKASTFFGNSYYGCSIKSNFATLFSLKEKRSVKFLLKRVDNAYTTQL